MRDALKISGFFIAVIVLGCLLAPILWWAGQAAGSAFGITFLQDQTFQRYFNRSMLIAAVALLWPVIRWLDIKNWQDFGLRPMPHPFKFCLVGFLLAFLLLIAMGLVAYALDIYKIQNTIRWDKFAKIIPTMVAVSLLEEFLFRGAILGLLLRRMKPQAALIFVSAVYSIVHFLKPMDVEVGPITWLSGFQLLPYSFHQFADPMLLLCGFLTLFAIGYVLGMTRLATLSLWPAIGLHAGWIAGNRVFNILFKRREEMMPWYGERIEIGIAPLITVTITGMLMMLYLRHRDRRRYL